MLRDIARLASASGLGRVIAIAASPILTRLYSPDAYGTLGVFMSYAGILSVIASLRYELAIPLAPGDSTVRALMKLCILLAAGMCLIVFFAGTVAGESLLPAVGSDALRNLFWLLPITVFSSALYQVLSSVAVRHKGYGAIARTKILESAASVAVKAGLGVASLGAAGLLAGQIVGTTAGTFSLIRWLKGLPPVVVDASAPTSVRHVARRYRRFAIFSAPAGLLSALSLNVPMLLVAAAYPQSAAGAFFLAQSVLKVPLTLLATSISQVYMGEASRLRREQQSLSPVFWPLAIRLFAVSTPAALLVWLLAPTVFPFVFGNSWVQAGVFASLTAPLLLFRFVTLSLAVTLTVLEKQSLTLFLQLALIAASIGSLWGSSQAGLDVEQAILIYGLVTASAYACFFIVLAKVVKNS